ncbi:MAG: hypothetical protein K0S74_531 [Chlamydiales bacterium]|jgi:hypothetical protein|nr:hypothetical protein [Chlamydiales bacterium]
MEPVKGFGSNNSINNTQSPVNVITNSKGKDSEKAALDNLINKVANDLMDYLNTTEQKSRSSLPQSKLTASSDTAHMNKARKKAIEAILEMIKSTTNSYIGELQGSLAQAGSVLAEASTQAEKNLKEAIQEVNSLRQEMEAHRKTHEKS